MELLLLVALICLGVAAQPLAAKRLPALVHGAVGSLCVGVSLALASLAVSGFVELPGGFSLSTQATAALPAVDLPPAPPKRNASPSDAAPLPNDESRFFADPESSDDDIRINSSDEETLFIPPGRPAWVESLPVREGEVHSTAVCSDPYATHQQAMHALDDKLQAATAEYIREHLESDLAPQLIRFKLAEIKRKLLTPQNVYHEKIVVSIGLMHQVHAKLEFGEEFRRELDRRWGELRATYRLAETGLVSGGVLLLLATVFGYFRLDNATRGYYTGRLQFMAAAAILAIVITGTMFSRWIYWL